MSYDCIFALFVILQASVYQPSRKQVEWAFTFYLLELWY